ncbi:MAG: hypothetical protein K2H91_02950 [Lachnospiraceae bacterium]|nr:hypothetical protein [Lachnospiraceae bacterium]
MGSFQTRSVGLIVLILLCIGCGVGCSSGQRPEEAIKEWETAESEISIYENPEGYYPEKQMQINEEMFYRQALEQGIDQEEAEIYLQVLMDDHIFQDGVMELTGLRIGDIDGNGQTDMLVVVMDAREKTFYGFGSLWFYMNEDDPYCFSEEWCPYYGDFDLFWANIDQDENMEIVYCARGSAYSGVGDYYKVVFKYRNHAIEQMQLPSDYGHEEYNDYGLLVDVFQEPDADSYRAYCPYFDEWLSFTAKNPEGWYLPDIEQYVGGNLGGYFDLCVAEYQGNKVLQASEYLYGECGYGHGVALAQFLITWEADGMPKVLKWWIEGVDNKWDDIHESKISFSDGYYYYISQSDHQL